ncbi:MAG: TlpA family protein disulfide reductase [Dysgonamonadaceae bacterium]|jgi:peroxiredoxin|nr:TlpA family protein disulfide reductase [Dysgonamonadaceae bacterium]
MKFKQLLFVAFIFVTFTSVLAANDAVGIEVKIPQLSERKIFLCYYFNGLIYKQDSLYLSPQGEGVFHNKENYKEGIYLIVLNSNQYADFLLSDDQTLTITITDTTDVFKHTRISGAEQSEAFQSWIDYLNEKRDAREQIQKQYQAFSEEEKEKNREQFQKQLDDLDEEVEQNQKNLIAHYKDQWVGRFFLGTQPVTTGPYPTPQTQEEFNKEFSYQKEHFFDNIDLQDRRFWRTNYFPLKVTEYMENQIEQHPDSLAAAASRLVAKTMGDSITFQLMMNRLIDFSAKSKIMGMENIWAKLVEDYYHKGFVTWGDSTHHSNIEFEYNKLRYNRIGMTAYDMDLQDSTGKQMKLYDLNEKYTLLYFYEPSCGHCIKTTPEIYEKIYRKYAGKGLDVAAVCISNDRQEWLNFVKQNHLEGAHWHNLWDPDRKSFFWHFYDTSATPSVYVLDKDKIIVAKKIDPSALDIIFGDYPDDSK